MELMLTRQIIVLLDLNVVYSEVLAQDWILFETSKLHGVTQSGYV